MPGIRWEWPAVVFSVTAICLLLHPFGPLGDSIWPPSPICPRPTDAQFPLFALVALAESASFGLGVVWVALGYKFVSNYFDELWRRVAMYIGISWQLLNWYPYDALHMNVGIDLTAMLMLELGFHVTMILVTVGIVLEVALPKSDDLE